MDKPKSPEAINPAGTPPPIRTSIPTPASGPVPPLFRRVDWLTFGLATLLVFIGYFLTLAPELTLEDSGELAVGSYYAGIPHPPGYPVWTIYTYFWSILPIGNIAWRVALGEAFSGALACGLLGLMVSRGSSMFVESIGALKNIDRRLENAICVVSGVVAGTLFGFNGFMWSQSVIVEVYAFSVLSLMGTLCALLRWIYAPHQRRYLYLAFFIFGICFTNHQTLLLAAMGLEVAIIATDRRIGRDLLMGNSVIYIAGCLAMTMGGLSGLYNNQALRGIYHLVGIPSVIGFLWLTFTTRKTPRDWIALGRDLVLVICIGYVIALVAWATEFLPPIDTRSKSFLLFHLLGMSALGFCAWLAFIGPKRQDTRLGKAYKPMIVLAVIAMMLLVVFSTGGTVANKIKGSVWTFWTWMGPMLAILIAFFWLSTRQREIGTEFKVVFMLGLMWTLGAGFYLYMPLAGMTCPPMQWGYPRTIEGFIHALTRGQYESARPTDVFNDPLKFVGQLGIVIKGVIQEFNVIYMLLATVPFFFLLRMQKRERSWLIGLTAVYLFMAVLLVIMLNPSWDRQSLELNRVFFTASHAIIAMFIGYAITLITALMLTHYDRFRGWGIVLGSIAIVIAIASLANQIFTFYGTSDDTGAFSLFFSGLARSFHRDQYALPIFANLLLLGIAVGFLLNLLLSRTKPHLVAALIVFTAMPAYSILYNWADNEQRNHWFGYWFGHDMFTPPYTKPDGTFGHYDAAGREEAMKGPNGALVYPEMARDAILFGGTDPGRFCPTYMIFCESFMEDRHKPVFDQAFDRRDVYIITQNALADGTYLQYIRSHYFRSAQQDPPFFQEALRLSSERTNNFTTNFVAALATELLDKPFTALGARIEARRRADGVYPPAEIYTPSDSDLQRCFAEYYQDAAERIRHDKLNPNAPRRVRPGEDITEENGRIQVRGQIAVMAINGLLTKVIFDQNPTNEFYVEESYPLEWMYPHLTPFGIIMKINREPLAELSDEICRQDHEFWSRYSERLIGNWITYDTPVEEITKFIEKVYLRHDYSGFQGDRKFLRDDQAQKAFSKLRSSIAGIYAWRLGMSGTFNTPQRYLPKTEAERQRMIREADFALRQAFAFCPYSPEAVFRYVQLLLNTGRLSDALLVAETCLKLDSENPSVIDLVNRLREYRQSGDLMQLQNEIVRLEQDLQANPADFPKAFDLAVKYAQVGRPERSILLLDNVLNHPALTAQSAIHAAEIFRQLNQPEKLEAALRKVTQLAPDEPEGWYNLAATQAGRGAASEAMTNLRKSLELNRLRLSQNPGAPDIRQYVASDPRMQPLRNLPEFRTLTNSP